MRRVRSKDTKPELFVRRLVSGMGFRYRLNSKTLPGHPDLVFSRLKRVIFVHGCFWHGHACEGADLPASILEYWNGKRLRNLARDRRTQRQLRRAGWKSLVKLEGRWKQDNRNRFWWEDPWNNCPCERNPYWQDYTFQSLTLKDCNDLVLIVLLKHSMLSDRRWGFDPHRWRTIETNLIHYFQTTGKDGIKDQRGSIAKLYSVLSVAWVWETLQTY